MGGNLENDLFEPNGWLAAVLPNPFLSAPDLRRSSEKDEELILSLAINEALIVEPQASSVGDVTDAIRDVSTSNAASFRSLRGIGLISAVFDELSSHLGKDFSTAELMRAAQTLIDISKTEYVPNPYKEPVERAGYFSWDVVRAFDQCWYVTDAEISRTEHFEDTLSPETLECARRLQQGWQELQWEF
jgi:hypothetical protein